MFPVFGFLEWARKIDLVRTKLYGFKRSGRNSVRNCEQHVRIKIKMPNSRAQNARRRNLNWPANGTVLRQTAARHGDDSGASSTNACCTRVYVGGERIWEITPSQARFIFSSSCCEMSNENIASLEIFANAYFPAPPPLELRNPKYSHWHSDRIEQTPVFCGRDGGGGWIVLSRIKLI